MIKTPLGSVELGMQYGKIVWCGFASVGSGSSVAPRTPGTLWAQKDTQMCPEEGESAAREQKCRLVCPSGAEWAQNATQMFPEEEKSATGEQIGIKMFPKEGKSASREQNCRLVCPGKEEGIPEYSLDDLLGGRGSIFRWEDLQLQGTPLQLRVWRELFNLLPDELITYSELANRCGYPRAVRAVATAVGKNPVSLIIPCHRVVRKSGNRGDVMKSGNHEDVRKSGNYAVVRKTGGPGVVRKSGNQAGGHKAGNQAEMRKSGSCKSAISAETWELGNYRWGSELKKRILEWEGII